MAKRVSAKTRRNMTMRAGSAGQPKKRGMNGSLKSTTRANSDASSEARILNRNIDLDPREVRFYRANEKPYGAFSNLYRRSIIFEGAEFPTAEHAYQAGKPRRDEVRDWILSAPTPALVAMAAHGLYTWDIVADWSVKKYDRMHRVLYAKFSQHPDLAKLLLDTGTARLVEVGRVPSTVNKTWGEVNGKGSNMLGRILMEVRSQLRTELVIGATRSAHRQTRKR